MTTVIPLASRCAVPTIPNVNAVHLLMSRNGTSTAPPKAVNVDAATLLATPDESELVRLHMAAVNALSHALHQLNGPDCGPQMWAAATSRAYRGLTALKQASALVNQVGG